MKKNLRIWLCQALLSRDKTVYGQDLTNKFQLNQEHLLRLQTLSYPKK